MQRRAQKPSTTKTNGRACTHLLDVAEGRQVGAAVHEGVEGVAGGLLPLGGHGGVAQHRVLRLALFCVVVWWSAALGCESLSVSGSIRDEGGWTPPEREADAP